MDEVKENGHTSEYVWSTSSPLGTTVVLKRSTYESHIRDPEERTGTEIENLCLVTDEARRVIESPRYIYCDSHYSDNQRVRYVDLSASESFGRIHALVVVVETDRDPQEVVTWIIKSNLRQELIPGGVIYDSAEHKSGPSEV